MRVQLTSNGNFKLAARFISGFISGSNLDVMSANGKILGAFGTGVQGDSSVRVQ